MSKWELLKYVALRQGPNPTDLHDLVYRGIPYQRKLSFKWTWKPAKLKA